MFEERRGTGKQIDSWNPVDDIAKYVPIAQLSRTAFDVGFYRSILFYLGIQWVRFDASRFNWTPINLPSWFPKNQTNKYAVACDGMKSVLEQARPETVFSPGSGDEADIATAEVCKDVTSVIESEVDQERLRSEAAALVILTGNAFVVDGYDMSPMNGEKSIQDMMCLRCAIAFPPHDAEEARGCPKCGGQEIMPAIDKSGQPIVSKYPMGKMDSKVIAPFGMLFDMQALYLDNSNYLIEAQTFPIEEIKGMFPDFAETIGEGQPIGKTGLFYQQALSYAVGTMGLSGTPSAGGREGNRGTLYTLRRKPCRELPYGGEALIVDETVVWKGELSTKADDGTPFYPVTHFGFKKVPGRVFYKTPAEDLIPKQVQRNKIESLIQLGAERVSNPTWLLPSGIGIEGITGEPGEKLTYNAHLGVKPERIQGSDMPNSLYRWLQIIDEDFADLAATYDVLLGKHPEGVDTLGGMQLLRDRGIARFQDALNSWGNGWTKVNQNRLMIWKQRVKDDRTMTVLGDNGKWDMKKFNSSTISGSIDCRPEEGTFMPKSKAYQQMMASQLLSAGMLDMSDPLTRWKLLTVFDAADLGKGLDIDVKDAIKEREIYLEHGMLRPREVVDNHEVHLAQHIRDAKSDAFYEEWQVEQQNGWMDHCDWHFNVLMKRAQMARMQDPSYARGQMANEAQMVRVKIDNEALAEKKQIELSAKQATAELKVHQGAVKAAEQELRLAKQKTHAVQGP
jgi:hypothetical protein